MRSRAKCLSAFVVAATLVTVVSCDLPTSASESSTLAVTPEAVSLLPQESTQLSAAIHRPDGTIASPSTVAWHSLDPSIATVDEHGNVTAQVHTGPQAVYTSVVGTAGGIRDTVPIEVRPWPVHRVVAAMDSLVLTPGQSVALDAVPMSSTGVALTGRELVWLPGDQSVVTISGAQVAAAPYNGTNDRYTSVVVYSEGVADTVVIRVAPHQPTEIIVTPDSIELAPGDEVTFAATARAGDIELDGSGITWTSSDETALAVGAGGEAVALHYVGPETRVIDVVATAGGASGRATVVIRPFAVATVDVFPATETLVPNRTVQLGAVLRDANGVFLEGHPITWTSSNTDVATVSSDGLVLTRLAGAATITAKSGDAVGEMQLNVVHPVISVDVTPKFSTVWLGRSETFTTVLRDTIGTVLTGRLVTWSSSDSTRATVSEDGVVTALSEGPVTITATAEGVVATASVDVFVEPQAAITITFDDGWRGVVEFAAPILDSLRLRANIGWITHADWGGVMTLDDLRALQARGWSILSHTMTHPFLTQLPLDSVAFELAGSRARVIESGFDPRVLILPYLDHNDPVLAASAAAGYTYTRCCILESWSPDTLISWPIAPDARHRITGVDVTNYDGQTTTYNFRTSEGRSALRMLLLDAVARRKFVDVFFHDVVPEDLHDLRLTLELLTEFRPYLITYGMLQ